jgi:hypothetical protein
MRSEKKGKKKWVFVGGMEVVVYYFVGVILSGKE